MLNGSSNKVSVLHEEQKTDVATKQSGLVAMLQSQKEENQKFHFHINDRHLNKRND